MLLNLRRKIHVMSGQGTIWTQARRWPWVIAWVKISAITAYALQSRDISFFITAPLLDFRAFPLLFFFFSWWPTSILILYPKQSVFIIAV